MENELIQQKIKESRILLYRNIEDAKQELEQLQSQCKHPNTHIGKYSWRIGCIEDAIICSDCFKFIKYLNEV